jgi:hypothetical protein
MIAPICNHCAKTLGEMAIKRGGKYCSRDCYYNHRLSLQECKSPAPEPESDTRMIVFACLISVITLAMAVMLFRMTTFCEDLVEIFKDIDKNM